MTEICPSADEKARREWTSEKLHEARRALLEDGFVVLTDVVALDHLVAIREQMLKEVEATLNRPDAPFNFVKANIQQDPPPYPPYLFKDVLLNDLIIQVTHSVLGDGVYNSFYSGNTALANTDQRQPVHFDQGHLFPGYFTPAHCLVVNLPLVDMSAANGAIELWPGTHKIAFGDARSSDIKIPAEELESRRAESPPFQPNVRLGSALIRDIRLWHAGMPNPSDAHRPMIAMIHNAFFFNPGGTVRFPASEREWFEHPILRTQAEWVEGDIDHTKNNAAFDYQEAR